VGQLVFATKRTAIALGSYFALLVVPSLIEMFSVFNPNLMRLREFDIVHNIVIMAQLPSLDLSQIVQAMTLGAGVIMLSTAAGIMLFELLDVS